MAPEPSRRPRYTRPGPRTVHRTTNEPVSLLNDLLGFSSLIVVSAAVFGPLASWYAARRSRRPLAWLILGALLGPVAMVLLAVAPPGRCVACDAAVRGWPSRCESCGLEFRPREAAAGPAEPPIQSDTWTGDEPLRLHPRSTAQEVPRPRLLATEPAPAPVHLAAAPPTVPHAGMDAGEMMATAVYFGGTVRLVVGSRYAVVRHGSILRLMGPLDRDPSIVAVECSLDRVIATAIDDRLVVSDSQLNGLAFALGGLAGATASQLEAALADEASDSRRAAR